MSAHGKAPGSAVAFGFEGREIHCRPGISVAAALTEARELGLRVGADGDLRGLFCGMGVCQECRVDIDGSRGVRACMTTVGDSMQVSRGKRGAPADPSPACVGVADDPVALQPDVLIIGAGAGGLTAASVAAESGADVVVLDERSIAGGQFYKQPSSSNAVASSLRKDRQIAEGRALIDRARRSGAKIILRSEVWGAFAPNEFAVSDGEGSRLYRPRHAIVATGAYERGLPLPGWTLPGVMTTGAAQVLLRSYGVVAGKRILVAGNGPLNLQVALELSRAGAEVVAVLELAATPGPPTLWHGLRMAWAAPRLTANGLRYLAGLRQSGVPVLYGHGLASVESLDTGLRATIGQVQADGVIAAGTIDTDIVCMGYGFQPNNNLLRCLGCEHGFDEERGHLTTKRSQECETTVAGIYAIGDCCGLHGAPTARDEGILAAVAALRSLGVAVTPATRRQESAARRKLGRHRSFQDALWKVFAAPRFQTELAKPDTPICRCENVRLRQIEEVLAVDDATIATVKRRTRLGMGPCQGRYCAPVVASLIARRHGKLLDEYSLFAPCSPIKPTRISEIAKWR